MAMAVIYLAVGILLLVAPPQNEKFPTKYLPYVGIVLVIYAIVRGYRVYKKYFVDYYEH